jgi:hypothetical protein
MPVRPRNVIPLLTDLGSVAGHRLVLLSLELYDQWADLRFARIDDEGSLALPRRVPPADAWQVAADGTSLAVHDAVGRGDRAFSNGEVRLDPLPAGARHLDVSVTLLPGHAPLVGSVTLERST